MRTCTNIGNAEKDEFVEDFRHLKNLHGMEMNEYERSMRKLRTKD